MNSACRKVAVVLYDGIKTMTAQTSAAVHTRHEPTKMNGTLSLFGVINYTRRKHR